jgi:hypothetical protein
LVKFTATNIGKYIPLPNAFNVRNSIELNDDIKKTDLDDKLRFISFDIQNMYTNISVEELLDNTDAQFRQNNIDIHTRYEIVWCCDAVLKQNYFLKGNTLYMQNDDLAMGSPTSSLFSKIYLQSLEYSKIVDILTRHHIIGYLRYINDILMMFQSEKMDIHKVLEDCNNINSKLKFTIEEKDSSINLLDLSIT